METGRVRQPSLRKKHPPHQNPELTTAQLTLGRSSAPKQPPAGEEAILSHRDVLEQAEELWASNDMLESINLLKGLLEYLRGAKIGEQQVLAQVHTNLAVSYYKIGFLEEAAQEFSHALATLREAAQGPKNAPSATRAQQQARQASKLKHDMLIARIELQVCILFSEMGKHEIALQHAHLVCRLAYNMIYDLLTLLYQHLSSLLAKNRNNYSNAYAPDKDLACEGHEDLLNNICIMEQLVSATKDFKQQFISREKTQLLEEQRYAIKKIGRLPSRGDLDLLYALSPENIDSLWVFKHKILDEIQMKFIKEDAFDTRTVLDNSELIQKVVYLAVSLYCYSTETRFLEKNRDQADPSQVLDSEHWLSRSLEIAYSFMPHEAPILSQILTVHDRFHGIDKQTIPEDREVGGFFKVLRPLSKPKSTFSSKNIMCSPIMIRIQVPKLELDIQEEEEQSSRQMKVHPQKIELANKTIDLDALTRNNKIRGLSHSKKYEFLESSHSAIKQKNNTKTDFTEHLRNIYATRKIKSVVEHSKNDRMKINLAGISPTADQSKSLRRPHSYDREIATEDHPHPLTERRKKSVSLHKKEPRSRSNTTSNSATLKLDGLQMLPRRNPDEEDGFEFEGRIANVEQKGGNIFINNNINLFISKESSQATDPQSTKSPGDRTVYEISKRQSYMNRRRAYNSVFTGVKEP